MDTLLEEINKKLDLILSKLNASEKEITISDYKEAILINFSYNEKLKNVIKEAGGKWFPSKSSWMFPKTRLHEIKDLIAQNFPEYLLKN
jgi:hypothetical protein